MYLHTTPPGLAMQPAFSPPHCLLIQPILHSFSRRFLKRTATTAAPKSSWTAYTAPPSSTMREGHQLGQAQASSAPLPGRRRAAVWAGGRGRILPCSTLGRPCRERWVPCWAPQHKGDLDRLERVQQRAMEMSKGLSTSPVRRGWDCSAWRSGGQGELTHVCT